MNETFSMSGTARFVVFGPRGIRKYEYKNLIVDAGKNVVRDLLNAGSGFALSRIAFGTGTTAATAADTGLENQTFIKNITDKVVSSKQVLCKLFVSTGDVSGTLNEAGLFAGTTLFSRIVLGTAIVKASDETLYVEWEINL